MNEILIAMLLVTMASSGLIFFFNARENRRRLRREAELARKAAEHYKRRL